MNAFTRQEIKAVHLTRSRSSADQLQRDRQPITYLPIVEARLQRIVGHQAIAQAENGIFDCVRRQIMHGPQSGLLLVELDAAACLKKGRCHADHLCALFLHEAWTERELVIYLDGGRNNRAGPDTQMQRRLQALGIGFAMSWENVGWFALDALIDARLIRFDVAALVPAQIGPIASMLQAAGRLGIHTLLTGISESEQIEHARDMGFDWLQGPLFNRLKVCA